MEKQKQPTKDGSKDWHGDSPLHEAVWQGDSDTMIALLNKGAAVDDVNHMGKTPLHYAAEKGFTGMAKILVTQFKADINKVNKNNNTPLHYAAALGHVETAAELVGLGARIDSTNTRGETPLHKAAEYGHAGVVEALLKLNASTSIMDCSGNTPLQTALQHGHSNIGMFQTT